MSGGISPFGQENPVRYRLPQERKGITFKFQIVAPLENAVVFPTIEDEIFDSVAGPQTRIVEGYCTVSTYDDGTPGEVFLIIGKEGHELHGWADKWSRLVSLLLQHGVHPQMVYDAMKFQTFEPSGFTNLSKVPICKSIPDLIVRYMEATFPPTAESLDSYESMLASLVEVEV